MMADQVSANQQIPLIAKKTLWHCITVSVFLFLAPPTSLPLQGGASQRKKLSAPRISLSLDQSEDDFGETPDDLDINVDDLDTPDEGDYLDYTDHEMDWEGG